MSYVATAPPVLAFLGALIVLVGTALTLLGLLLRLRKRSGDEDLNAVGTSAIGIGGAVAFVGLASDLTTAEKVALVVTSVVLIVGVVVGFRRAGPQVPVEAPEPDACKHECHGRETHDR